MLLTVDTMGDRLGRDGESSLGLAVAATEGLASFAPPFSGIAMGIAPGGDQRGGAAEAVVVEVELLRRISGLAVN